MGRAALHGSFWMMVQTIVGRVASLAATVCLGWWLTKSDFGVYGLAMSIASLATVMRDGGVRNLLVQRHAEHDALIGPVFYMALAFNLTTGLLIAGMAYPMAAWFGQPAVVPLMFVIAATQPLSTPGAILQVKLFGQMRFGVYSFIQSVSAMIRFGGAIVLAGLFGDRLGAMAFVLPLPACAVFEWAAAWWWNRETVWRRGAGVDRWLGMLSHTSWLMLGGFAIAVMNWGTNVVLGGVTKDAEFVGVYFFAFQIIIQVGMLLSSNINQVLFPVFTRLLGEPERLRQAVLRSLRQMMLLAGVLSLGLAVTFAPLERLIWGGKWAGAGEAVRVLGALYPLMVALAIPLAIQQAKGAFRQWGIGLIVVGAINLAGAVVGALVFHSATGVALAVGVMGGLAATGYAVVIARGIGVPWTRSLGAMMPPWIVALAAAGVTLALPWYFQWNMHPLAEFVVMGVVFTLVFAAVVRVAFPWRVRETIGVLPARVRALACRVMLLREEPA